MKKFDIFTFALSNFLRRKARSALTVLGVVIGTAAVVIMLSIGIGMNKGFEDQISSWGNLRQINVYEMTGSWNEETDEWEPAAVVEPLDDITLNNIRNIKHVKAATPNQYSRYAYYLYKDRSEWTYTFDLRGIDAGSMKDFDYEVLAGRLLDERDIGTTNFVMAFNTAFNFNDIKETDWMNMHSYETHTSDEELPFDPVNEFDNTVLYQFCWTSDVYGSAVDTTKPRIIPQDAKCVGVLKVSDTDSWDFYAYMDYDGLTEMDKKLEENQNKYYSDMWGEEVYIGYGYNEDTNYADGRKSKYPNLNVLVDDTDHVLEVQNAINDMKLRTNSSMDTLQQMQEQTKFLRSILGAIGVVAFFVAAISIANTMVMSIYERTREIGIMKVIGCKLKDIRGMFLVEAAIIGIVGGALGVVLSYGLSALVNKLAAGGGMQAFGIYSSDSVLSIIPLWLDIAALALATAVGVFSGLYPAIRATRLSALEAIKNE